MGCTASTPKGIAATPPSSVPEEVAVMPPPAPEEVAATSRADLELDFDACLLSSVGAEKILAWSTAEHSEENISFYLEVQAYKTADEAACEDLGKSIVAKYLDRDATSPVNLPTRITKRFTGDPIKGEATGNYTFTADVFDDAEAEIRTLLRKDTFARFRESNMGKALLAERPELGITTAGAPSPPPSPPEPRQETTEAAPFVAVCRVT